MKAQNAIDPTKRKIVIATNSLTAAMKPAYSNHNQFWFNVGKDYGGKYQFIYVNPGRLSIDRFRNLAAETAIKYDCDYILWLDDDVLVPANGLTKLINAMELYDAQVVAGNVIVRGYPFDYMAFLYLEDGVNLKIMSQKGDGVQEVGAVGFSFCLLSVKPLKKMKEDFPKVPFFLTAPNHTEDIFYCVRLKELMKEETKILIDWSIECQHIMGEEVISEGNRAVYREYFEKINPSVLEPDNQDTIQLESDKPTDYVSALNQIVQQDLKEQKIVEV